jgi:hypothetical protein
MRLAQLARKASLKTSEIVNFLASKNITIEDNANTKIDEVQVKIILVHFAPHLLELPTTVLEQPEEVFIAKPESIIEVENVEPPIIDELPTISTITREELIDSLPDIIRAPKVELSGLKVIGKIELPEKVKTEKPIVGNSESSEVATPPLSKKIQSSYREKQRVRPTKNNIAAIREQQEQVEAEKRKLALEQRKEIRKQNYFKKRASNIQPKKVKLEEKPVAVVEKKKMDKNQSVWNRFFNWLFSQQ